MKTEEPARRAFDRQAAIQAQIIHSENHECNRRRLEGFYGKVARKQNEWILAHCQGNRILDVGAGYGNLTRQLLEAGKEAIGIEVDEEKIRRAREWFGVDLQFLDFYAWDSPVDTVIFREVFNHLELDRALTKAFSLTRERCLVFQGTEILPLRWAKRLYGHHEYDQKTPQGIIAGLQRAGFAIREIRFRDTLAFPLSGGFAGHRLLPQFSWLESLVLLADQVTTTGVTALGLDSRLCFRVLIVAEKPRDRCD